jgi:uncharacterized protein YdaU (DUF1376 family)
MSRNGRLPWFPFYAEDWLRDMDVRMMTLAEQGAYMRLLAHAWVEGGIPDDPEGLSRLVGASESEFRCWWEGRIGKKFVPSGRSNGLLVNRRLEEIRAGQAKQHKRLSEAGKAGAASRYRKDS